MPEKIETIYIRSQYVQQVFVCGESLKASCLDLLYNDQNSQRTSLFFSLYIYIYI